MTFKDLLRLLRRRWPVASLAFVVVFAGFWIFSRFREQPQFRARARVFVATPPMLLTATQGTQWLSISTTDPKTWISLIQGPNVRAATLERLRARKEYSEPGALKPEWLSSISAVAEGGEQLLWVEATASSPRVAADIANEAAEAAVIHSQAKANLQLEDAKKKAQQNVDEETSRIANLEFKVDQIRERARTELGSDSLEVDVRKVQEEILALESRRRDLERRSSANRLRLERVREDRSAVEHLGREAVPRTASVQIRIAEHPQVKALTERLEQLHRDLNTLLRKYTNEHPAVKGLRGDIRESEVELTRAESQAVGRDIDAEELAIRTEKQLTDIELRVLVPDLKEREARLRALSPVLDDVQRREREIADAKTRLAPLDALKTQLLTAPPAAGYISIEDKANPAEAQPIEMKLRKSWPVALLAAVIVGFSFAFLVDFLDTSIRNDYDVRRHLDYPVLSVIPRVAAGEVLTVETTRTSIVSEIYDTLATVLLSTPGPQPSRIFLVTSTNPQEGKTAVSTNLAVALARQGKRTLLIDGDMRIPTVHSSLGLANTTGLSDLLAGTVQLTTEGVLQDVAVPNLKVMTSGLTPENPYELLDPARIAPLGAIFREPFDAVVIDTPPVLQAGDALKFSTLADHVLFVIKAGATDVRQATWAKRLLSNVSAKVTGVVLNGTPRDSGEYYHDPYYRHARSARNF